ncbi:MAG TPA: NBR1-Ig-like domain-containing protein [Anaerolineales bacterium]|nr:NBR1-Ig-like domain-containing protein [Anaerolineales bacterium]
MKSKLQAVSALLLIALVLSFIPAAALPSSASAVQACTDRAQFITDVTVPDGTRYDPGATFTKTWRLRNIGTCTWTTSYTMVFDSGTQMGSTASVAMPSNVAPGQNVDLSVNMTAPSAAGHYIGYWKFKNAAGVLFGIGVQANKSWWVEINVKGTPTTGVAYDFTANANASGTVWSSGAGGLTFPGTDGDAKGFAFRMDNPNFESGVVATQPGLLVSPQQITNGYIQAIYPEFTVQSGDRFQATVGCQAGATSCYVAYRLDYQVGNTVRTFWTFREKFEGWTYNANLNLSPLAGKNVRFILYISAYGSPVGDRALWGNPVIARAGVITPPTVTGTPPTVTPTSTPGPVTVTVPPSSCDKAQFISDRTIPDGTVLAPGATFTKTWRLKNVGTCAWSTSYQLVFFSGEQMGAASSAAFPGNVPVGQTVDISINMTAPSAAGSYRGYWMFKNASGALFGIGAQANKPWWVDIRVSGPTVTPGGPTVTATPTGPTTTPGANTAYDFATNACAATWYTGAGQIPASQCPGTDGDAKGFVLKVSNPKLESGATDPRPGIITFPQNVQNGYIQGFFPPFRVQTGDRFRSIINCEAGATNCYVVFRLDYQTGNDPIRTFWGPFLERYEGKFYSVDVDLSSLNGRDVKFILTVLSYGSPTGDRALWVGPHIYRVGASPATSVPTTAVSTTPATPVATTAVPTTAVPGSATVTNTPVTPSATPATPSATPDTPSPTATTGSTTGLYQNTKYNFKFTLPSGANIVSQSDNTGRVTLPIVTAGTNLLSKYIQIHVVEDANPCVSPAVDGIPSTTENVTINSIPFVKTTGQGAAAGNRYDWTAYATTSNNACISLAFILHSANPGNYATPPPVFDMAAESAVIGTTMSTYSKIS